MKPIWILLITLTTVYLAAGIGFEDLNAFSWNKKCWIIYTGIVIVMGCVYWLILGEKKSKIKKY